MIFKMTHRIFKKTQPEIFTEKTAPDWLTSATTPGSTMDCRWFWNEHVLTLPVGGIVKTDFRIIKRIE